MSATTARQVLPLDRLLVPIQHAGDREDRDQAVQFGFSLPQEGAPLLAAFLVIPTQTSATAAGRSLDFEVRLLIDPWPEREPAIGPERAGSSAGLGQRTGLARAHGLATAGATARIDVTALVQRWLAHPRSAHGLQLIAHDAAGSPAALSPLATAQAYLELYPRIVNAQAEAKR